MEIKLKTCLFLRNFAIFLIMILVTNRTYAELFTDYLPVDPKGYGIKTFEWTYGQSGQYTSEIIGTEVVPYTSGAITGAKISNFSDMGNGIVSNNGVNVKILGWENYYLSTDSSLTNHHPGWSLSTLYDGMIIDQGEWYVVQNDLSTWTMENDQHLLIDIQDVTVLNGNYSNAIIIWWLDTDHTYEPLNFYGKDSDLGLTLPTSSDTGGYSVTAFDIFGFGTGPIAVGDISAGDINPDTDSLIDLSELREIKPVPNGDFCGVNFGPADGYVDVWDLMYFADCWHCRSGDPCWDDSSTPCSICDLAGPNFVDPDGYIDVWDLMTFADNWHTGQQP